LFGFKGKVIFGLEASINLNRITSNDPIIRSAAAGDTNLSINKLVWRVPTLILSTPEETNLYTLVSKNTNIELGFLSRQSQQKPVPQTKFFSWNFNLSGNEKIMGILLFFQTDRTNDQIKNPALFDHCNLTNAKVIINGYWFPGIDLKCNFKNNEYIECYQRYLEFRRKFTDGLPEVDPFLFKKLYPMFVFDVSRQEGRLTGNAISATIECSFESNVPANTTAHAILLSDKMLQFEFANVEGRNVMRFNF
jgi:hypothetical protein